MNNLRPPMQWPALPSRSKLAAIGRDDTVKLLSGPGFLHDVVGIQKGELAGHHVLVPAGDLFARVLQGQRQAQLRADAIAIGADVADDAEGAVLAGCPR